MDEVTIDSDIDLTPDKFGRWQIRGFIKVSTKAMPEFKQFGKSMLMPVAYIDKRGSEGFNNLCSTFWKFGAKVICAEDTHFGFTTEYVYGETPNDVMRKVERRFKKVFDCLTMR